MEVCLLNMAKFYLWRIYIYCYKYYYMIFNVMTLLYVMLNVYMKLSTFLGEKAKVKT